MQSARNASLGNPLRKEESRNITEAPEGFMKENDIPYMTDVADSILAKTTFPIRNIIDEIADAVNISESFDYVIDHLECAEQRENMRPKKALLLQGVAEAIKKRGIL